MADNIIKNEFMWEEGQKKKKQLYKNWKLYASALGIIVIGLGVGLGVGLGMQHNSPTTPIAPINLSDLNLKTTIAKTVTSSSEAWNAFINENSTITDLENNVEAGTFIPSDYAISGSLEITAKADSKYSGAITVNFSSLTQSPIDNGLLIKTIDGTEAIQNDETGNVAFNAFLTINNSWTNLKDLVEYSSFIKPTYTTNGSLTITAKANTPYYGDLKVSITKLAKKELSSLGLNISLPEAYIEQTEAFQAFINLNSQVSDLENNVTVSNFNPSKYGDDGAGSLEITAKPDGKYNGTITVDIAALTQTNLNTLNLDPIIGSENMQEEDAFNAFLANNTDKDLTDLKDNVNLKFNAPGYGNNNGSLTITAKANSKYTGSITISINAITQTNLSDFNTTAIIGSENMSVDDAFSAFLANNINATDLKDNVDLVFIAPDVNNDGSLTITAKVATKYTGSIKVSITKLAKKELSSLGLNISLPEAYIEQTEAFQAFINLNSQVSDLETNVTVSNFNPSKYGDDGAGSLEITAKPDGKYNGTITVTFSARTATDEEIVDTITNSGITFGATATMNQSLNDFINQVINGNNDNNKANDKYWFIRGQLRDHLDDYDILNGADLTKYEFVKLTDENGTDLTNAILTTRGTKNIKFVYNYGTMKNQSVKFILNVN